MTDDCIYEIKLTLTRDALFHALGQVLVYRNEINPSADACIVGLEDPNHILLGYKIDDLGVTVVPLEGIDK